MQLELRAKKIDLKHRAVLVGVLNVTPDSFSDAGRFANVDAALAHARYLIAQGADAVDIGGESTRPGAEPVSLQEELRRVVPVIRAVREAGLEAPISIDTQKAEVARRALDAGADIVNDVSALQGDPDMAPLLAERKTPVILMHHRGTSREMYARADYNDVVEEVRAELAERAAFALEAGIERERIILDPGIGFAKRAEHSWKVLDGVGGIVALGFPVMIGTSRKSFLQDVFGSTDSALERGTQGTSIAALERGARLIRVHEPGPLKALRWFVD